MYCGGCGTFSRIETVHECPDPSQEVVLAAAAPLAVPTSAPPGWYPEGAERGLLRWWDGQEWTGHVAAPAGHAGGPAPDLGVHGRFLGAIPRTVGRRGRFDVLVYERSLVLSKVAGTDPATIGLLVGTVTVGWVLGYIIGDHVGASGNDARVRELAGRGPEAVAAADRRNAVVPRSSVRSADVVSQGRWGGRLDLRLHEGTRLRRRWTRPHSRGSDPAALLAQPLQGLGTFRQAPPWRLVLGLAGAVLLVAATVLSIVLPIVADGRDRADFRRAQAEVGPACVRFLELSDRLEEGDVPTLEELAASVDPMVEPFARAAEHHDDYLPANEAVARLQELVHSEGRPEQLRAIGPQASTVWTACTW